MKNCSLILVLLFGTCSSLKIGPERFNLNLIATGMTGDEDLGQDIIMKDAFV